MFSRKDLVFSLITGFYTGLIAWRIFIFLGIPVITFWDRASCSRCIIDEFSGNIICPMIQCIPDYLIVIPTWWFVIIVPILWILGVNLGYFLGKWLAFFNQFGKYAAIGFTNFAVDAAIINLLIASSGIASGIWFSVFKAVSFASAVTHSYFWNRSWVFESGGKGQQEFLKFAVVNLVAMAVNVGTASFVVNGLDPFFGLNENKWANIGSIAGSAVALVFSFVGFRLVVFRKTTQANKPIS